jgi:hypothetical protein
LGRLNVFDCEKEVAGRALGEHGDTMCTFTQTSEDVECMVTGS